MHEIFLLAYYLSAGEKRLRMKLFWEVMRFLMKIPVTAPTPRTAASAQCPTTSSRVAESDPSARSRKWDAHAALLHTQPALFTFTSSTAAPESAERPTGTGCVILDVNPHVKRITPKLKGTQSILSRSSSDAPAERGGAWSAVPQERGEDSFLRQKSKSNWIPPL